MKYIILQSPTPLDQLAEDFVPTYEQFIEYAKVAMLFIAIAGVLRAVLKSGRN